MKAYYHIKEIEIPVTLGVYQDEKKRFVTVPVDIEFLLAEASKGQETDSINDTVNYGLVCETAMEAVSSKEFDLVETLVGAIYDAVIKILPVESALKVSALKKILPLPYVKGGVLYSYTEKPEVFLR